MQFDCELWKDGICLARFTVPGVEMGLIGAFDALGVPWAPSLLAIAGNMPYRLRKAVLKSDVWETTRYMGGVDCFHVPVTGCRGKTLGSVYCFPKKGEV